MPVPTFSTSALPGRAVMGIVNVTPDSFSGDGLAGDPEAAAAHGLALAEAGAHLIDVGGESTRPGAEPVSEAEELDRVVPVVERLAARLEVPVSVDTRRSAVAAAALTAGARVVNDVSAATHDPALLGVVVAHDAGLVLMHMQGTPRTMQDAPHYDDVVGEVTGFLAERIGAAVAAGVRADAIVADPGFGFGKTLEHNLALLAGVPALVGALDVPLLVGVSRKRFLGALIGADEPRDREDPTLATTVWAWSQGARVVRVHDVTAAVRAARFLDVVERATQDGVAA